MREKIIEAVTYKGDIEIAYMNLNGYECYATLPLSYFIDTEAISISVNDGYLNINDKKIDVYDILRLKRKQEEDEYDEYDEYDEEEDEE